MMLKRASMFFVLMLFFADNMYAKKSESPPYIQYVHEITNSFAKEMEEELNVVCIGSGGGMPFDVEEISVKFISYQEGRIEKARALVIYGVNKLLLKINSQEKIRPYLREFPFKPNRVDIGFAFRELENNAYYEGEIVNVSLLSGKLFYRIRNSSTGNLQNILVETYEEALKKNIPKKLES